MVMRQRAYHPRWQAFLILGFLIPQQVLKSEHLYRVSKHLVSIVEMRKVLFESEVEVKPMLRTTFIVPIAAIERYYLLYFSASKQLFSNARCKSSRIVKIFIFRLFKNYSFMVCCFLYVGF